MQRTVNHAGLIHTVTLSETDDTALAEGQSAFLQYRTEGVILNESMDDEIWQLTDQKHTIHLSFCLTEAEFHDGAETWVGCTFSEFMLTLKLFALFQLGVYVLDHIQQMVRVCLTLARQSFHAFSADPPTVPGVLDFLSFLPGESASRDRLMEELEEKAMVGISFSGHSRTLAPFGTYVTFEERLSSYWKVCSPEEKLTVFPVYLWWTLTCILPLRPTEFLLLPDDCLHEVDGKYILTVRRTRLKKNCRTVYYRIADDYSCFDYVIPHGLAEMIQSYRQAKAGHPQPALDTLLLPVREHTYFHYGAMRALLHDTLTELDMDPRCIHLGDTRHLSMISLILSGDTPSVCKALANHESIMISSGYFANMGTLNDCQVMHFLQESISPVTLIPPRETSESVTEGNLRLPNGFCAYYTVTNYDARECVKYSDPLVGIGRCCVCPHFVPDSHNVLIRMKQETKWQLDLSLRLLMESLELLRAGKGCEQNIDLILKQIKSKAMLYLAHVRKENQDGTSSESII